MKLIVIEGVDGAGKSTQIRLLSDYYKQLGSSTRYLHFPRTETPYFGELIARFLRGEFGSNESVDPQLVAMLYAGDRRDASELIRNWLNEGQVVLLDRYTYSNIAYQCAKIENEERRKELREWIFKLEFVHFGIPKPELNIFLDVPMAFTENKLSKSRSGSDRNYLKGNRDIHEESMTFQRRVREIYLEVAALDSSLSVINCSNDSNEMLSPEEVFALILKALKSKKLI